jgi:hypothetical protein
VPRRRSAQLSYSPFQQEIVRPVYRGSLAIQIRTDPRVVVR